MSRLMRAVMWPPSAASIMSSRILHSAVSVEWPRLYADCRLFQWDDEQMCGFSLTTASHSTSFDTVDTGQVANRTKVFHDRFLIVTGHLAKWLVPILVAIRQTSGSELFVHCMSIVCIHCMSICTAFITVFLFYFYLFCIFFCSLYFVYFCIL